MLEISISGMEEIQARFRAIQERSGNLRTLMLEIGEDLVESTKQRFVTTTSPDGDQWQENSMKTIARKGHDQQLTGKTHQLRNTINYLPLSDYGVEIGSPMEYARVQQQGGLSHWEEYGENWIIPARPFLGLSDQDKQNILDLTLHYLL